MQHPDPAAAGALQEGVFRRAVRDAARGAQSLLFVLATLVLDATAAVLSVLFLAEDVGTATRAAAAALAVLAGTALALLALVGFRLLRAPILQRNEARAALAHLRGEDADPDPGLFADEFSVFVRTAETARPRRKPHRDGLVRPGPCLARDGRRRVPERR